MDLEQINNLPDELKERYSKLERLFASPGWELVLEWAKTRKEGADNRQLHSATWDHTLVNRGASFAYGELASLQEATEQEFAAIAAANAMQTQLVDEFEHE